METIGNDIWNDISKQNQPQDGIAENADKTEEKTFSPEPFNVQDYIEGLAVAILDGAFFAFTLLFVCFVFENWILDISRPFGEHGWYHYVFLQYGYIWPILFCALWSYAYKSRNKYRNFYNSICSIGSFLIITFFYFGNKKSRTTRHYFFWTDFN